MKPLRTFLHAGACLCVMAGCINKPLDITPVDTTKNITQALTPGAPIEYDTSKKYIFLSWDDAPQPPGTRHSKDLFHQLGVKATFFAVGMHYEMDAARKLLTDSIRDSYPEFLLANHSYSHAFRDKYHLFYTHIDSAVADFMHAQDVMHISAKILRMPGRNSWANDEKVRSPKSSEQVARKLDSLGFHIIGWDVEWQFTKGSHPRQSAEEMIRQINAKLKSGSTNQPNTIVILAHDRMFASQPCIDSLAKVINALKQDTHNVFETIDHYPSVQKRP